MGSIKLKTKVCRTLVLSLILTCIEVGWLALSPTEVELRGALDAALAVLRAQFYAHFSTLVSDSLDLAVAPIVDNTTWSELENITATVLADLEVECANGSCAFSPLLRSTVLAELGGSTCAVIRAKLSV